MSHSPAFHLRTHGLYPGVYEAGSTNSISDVADLLIGHVTLNSGVDIRTGATAIIPHTGNIYQERVPAGIAVGNGFGKLTGSTQVFELGEIETPIVLTNTLSVPRAADAVISWVLDYPGNESVFSVNPLVAETNDAFLNNIRKRALTTEIIEQAIKSSSPNPPDEGAVGAGTGTVCFGWKGGIGSSSRIVTNNNDRWTIGALVQTNFGGRLTILGVPIWQHIQPEKRQKSTSGDNPGSIIIILATDAPISDRNLHRLAQRAFGGLARTGASLANGSGDYVIAFSTAQSVRRRSTHRNQIPRIDEIPNDQLSSFFEAAIEVTEEAIYNSLTTASNMNGYLGHSVQALPLQEVVRLVKKYR